MDLTKKEPSREEISRELDRRLRNGKGERDKGPGPACQSCPYQDRQKMLEFLGWKSS